MPRVKDNKTAVKDILNKWVEGYKIEPDAYKEKLLLFIYNAWCNVLPTKEEY